MPRFACWCASLGVAGAATVLGCNDEPQAILTAKGVSSVTVSPRSVTIDRGSTRQMSATVVADAGISSAVSWRSTNDLAVSVSSTGMISAVDPGLAYVVATSTAEPVKRDSSLVTVPDTCATPQAYTLGSTVNGSLGVADCEGGRSDYYTYSSSTTSWFSVTLTHASSFLFLLSLADEAGPLASRPGFAISVSGSATDLVLASAGSHRIGVSTLSDTTLRGSYTLSTTVNPVSHPCSRVTTTLAVSRSFVLSNACWEYAPSGLAGTFYVQHFLLTVPSNRTLRVTVVAATYQARIELKKSDGTLLASAFAPVAGAAAELVFTPSSTLDGSLWVTSQTAGAVGAFTITIDP